MHLMSVDQAWIGKGSCSSGSSKYKDHDNSTVLRTLTILGEEEGGIMKSALSVLAAVGNLIGVGWVYLTSATAVLLCKKL